MDKHMNFYVEDYYGSMSEKENIIQYYRDKVEDYLPSNIERVRFFCGCIIIYYEDRVEDKIGDLLTKKLKLVVTDLIDCNKYCGISIAPVDYEILAKFITKYNISDDAYRLLEAQYPQMPKI